ncbi:MAG: tRNA guanosine(34) transglycosylase Tgt [Defluviitaleaceae bacterium]|nr:tRNA guanosine(34) transglycosylase Tgt [Defluviitaleaceae bacterium]
MYSILSTQNQAKRGRLVTPHGIIETPVFMNVATLAAIKGAVSSRDLRDVGCQVALCNTYHLHLRPGEEIVRSLGGLGPFMAWEGPTLTDSGGFQVFSLGALRKIKEEGVYFSSHIDGRKIFMGPEESMSIQSALGATIVMAFDECPPHPASREYVQDSVDRTTRWLNRCIDHMKILGSNQLLFGINQGGVYEDIRIEHAKTIVEMDLPGYAIGGLAVGETHGEMYRILECVVPHLPQNKPTYLMGVGTPENLLEAVARGIDFFDCVLPARNGRHGHVYTSRGKINLHNACHKLDNEPIDPDCGCPACKDFSRAYIWHLFKAKEMLAMRLCVLHNLYFYNKLMADIRLAIDESRFDTFKTESLSRWAR